MKLSAETLLLCIFGVVATIAASHATFGGVKPDLKAQDLIPGALPANAENR